MAKQKDRNKQKNGQVEIQKQTKKMAKQKYACWALDSNIVWSTVQDIFVGPWNPTSEWKIWVCLWKIWICFQNYFLNQSIENEVQEYLNGKYGYVFRTIFILDPSIENEVIEMRKKRTQVKMKMFYVCSLVISGVRAGILLAYQLIS